MFKVNVIFNLQGFEPISTQNHLTKLFLYQIFRSQFSSLIPIFESADKLLTFDIQLVSRRRRALAIIALKILWKEFAW